MTIDFNSKTHTYYVDGDVATISVTELLQKHGIAEDFSAVPQKTLKKKAQFGTAVHKDIERVIYGVEPRTFQGRMFHEWALKNCSGCIPETLLAVQAFGITVAGTCDLIGIERGKLFIADHKTKTKVNEQCVSWQVSLYDYMARKMGTIKNLDEEFEYTGAERFYCFQYDADKMTVIPLEKVPDTEIERLLEAEASGQIYKKPELIVADDFRLKVEQAESLLMRIEQARESALETAKRLREELLRQMKEQGVKSWETDELKVSLVRGTERKTVDSEKLRRIFPKAYEVCTKTTTIKDSIRVTPKGVKNDKE